MDEPSEIVALREALKYSPDNLPLTLHLLRTLCKYGRYASVVDESRVALRQFPQHLGLSLLLLQGFVQTGRLNEGLVVLESLEKRGEMLPHDIMDVARMLSRTTELVKAAQLYQEALKADPSLRDTQIEQELAPFLMPSSAGPLGQREAPLPAGDVPGSTGISPERSAITFADVGGMDSVKEEIRMKIIHPITHADLFKAYGKKTGGGILLYGPPGCGKTHLARATAGEVRASFFIIGLHEVLDMWIGQSEKNLHAVFEQARASRPAILFIDEVDALGASRADFRHSASRNTINQFLSELDGITGNNEGLLVLGATNAPWHLDTALRRPGRFDQIIFVPPPDAPGREAILRVMLQNRPAENIDYAAIAKRTEGFSGADLKAVVDRAVESRLDEAMKKGRMIPVTTKDLEASARKVKPSTREWFSTARNYALYSNDGGAYDDILEYLNIRKP